MPPKSLIPIPQIADSLREHIKKTSQKSIRRNINIDEIPVEDLDILCNYFPILLITRMFGGNYQIILKDYNARIKIKEAEEVYHESVFDEESFEPLEPSGIGGHQYAERLRQKVFRQLETVLNMGVNVAGHSQLVQAAKTLLLEADKSKDESAGVMMAYQTQLLLFAEHIEELFLPALGVEFKRELCDFRDEIIQKLETKVPKPDKELLEIWQEEVGKLVRSFSRKRFELMLAETILDNSELSDALDFSKDLIETYRQTDIIDRDSKSVVRLKDHIQRRDGE
jgi:hypothetical protein